MISRSIKTHKMSHDQFDKHLKELHLNDDHEFIEYIDNLVNSFINIMNEFSILFDVYVMTYGLKPGIKKLH